MRRSFVLVATAALLAGCNATSASSPSATDGTASAAAGSVAGPSGSGRAGQAANPDGASASSASGSSSTTASTSGVRAAASSSASSAAPGVAGAPLLRVAGITDGDTIKVWVDGRKEAVRLLGIDTPETKKPDTAVACYGKEATSKMQSLAQSREVSLVADPSQSDRDRYGRLLRYVVLTDGTDVGEQLVAGGFAREVTYDGPYARQSAYRAAQSSARAKNIGLWRWCTYESAFSPSTVAAAPATGAPAAPPAVAAKPAPKPPATKPSTGGQCLIKGNISSKGERIYHSPGQQHYADTVITESKGERWFCSAQEAQAAGWRAAKR